jgi:hypothetical protein
MPIDKSKPVTHKSSSVFAIESIGGGFTVSSRQKPPQSVGVLIGDGGSGKTTFVTQYCPGPIAFFNFDGRSSEAVEKAKEERGEGIIQEVSIEFPFDTIFLEKSRASLEAKKVVKEFMSNLMIARDAARNGIIKTIAIDTGTELNDLFQLYARGDLETTKTGDRGSSKFLINRQWLTIFQIAKSSGANFIVLGRPRQVWRDNQPVKDTFTPYLPDVCNDATDWTGKISANVISPKTSKKPAEIEFEIKMFKAGPNISELGRTYTNREWEGRGGPFAYISTQMYQKVNRKVWMP